jgi:hypothetical protein
MRRARASRDLRVTSAKRFSGGMVDILGNLRG